MPVNALRLPPSESDFGCCSFKCGASVFVDLLIYVATIGLFDPCFVMQCLVSFLIIT